MFLPFCQFSFIIIKHEKLLQNVFDGFDVSQSFNVCLVPLLKYEIQKENTCGTK